MYIKRVVIEGVDWILLFSRMVKWRGQALTVKNILLECGKFWGIY
jgi:hypothetical protein